MQNDLNYLRERIDVISDVLTRNTVILEKNTESLQEHMRRTDILEQQMQTALIPVKTAKILGYIIGLLTTTAGAILGIWELFRKQKEHMKQDMPQKKKFGKLKMPEKRPEMDLSELDETAPPSDEMDNMDDQSGPPEGSPEEESMESPAEESAESSELEQVPDEDLMAEVKKRGLMASMGKDDSEASDEMSYQILPL